MSTNIYKYLQQFVNMEYLKVCEIKKSGQKFVTIPKDSELYNSKYVKVEKTQE